MWFLGPWGLGSFLLGEKLSFLKWKLSLGSTRWSPFCSRLYSAVRGALGDTDHQGVVTGSRLSLTLPDAIRGLLWEGVNVPTGKLCVPCECLNLSVACCVKLMLTAQDLALLVAPSLSYYHPMMGLWSGLRLTVLRVGAGSALRAHFWQCWI